MTDEPTDDFWGEKGEQYWRDLGAQCSASELQIKFACARYQGASATGAARLAGYAHSPDDPAAIRQAGHKAIRSTAVAAMLALASAEDEPPSTATKVMDRAGRVAHLSSIAHKSPDPTLKIRAIEALNKMEDQATELNQTQETDGLHDDRIIRDLLLTPGGAAAVVCLHMGSRTAISRIALLHDVHRACMADPVSRVVWDMAVKKCSPNMQEDLRALLSKPDWQLETREKLWLEVDVDPQKLDKTIPIDWPHEWVPQLKNQNVEQPSHGSVGSVVPLFQRH